MKNKEVITFEQLAINNYNEQMERLRKTGGTVYLTGKEWKVVSNMLMKQNKTTNKN